MEAIVDSMSLDAFGYVPSTILRFSTEALMTLLVEMTIWHLRATITHLFGE